MTREADGSYETGDFPQRVTLELTNRCNVSCTFCPRRFMTGPQGDMDIGTATRLIEEMANHLPVTLVPFFRGEPLLHPGWMEILSYAKRKGLGPIQFTTNATLMDRRASEAILDLGLDFISFSVDTTDPVLYEQTRRGAVYEKVLQNILYLVEIREKRGSRIPEIQVSAVETAMHQQGMDAFVDFWRTRVDRVRIYVEHSGNGRPGSISRGLPPFEKRQPCRKIFTDMVIYWDGEVALCNHDWTRTRANRIGNARLQGIGMVWTSEEYGAIRRAHLAADLSDMAPCDHCDHWKMYSLPEGLMGRCYEGSRSKTRHSFQEE